MMNQLKRRSFIKALAAMGAIPKVGFGKPLDPTGGQEIPVNGPAEAPQSDFVVIDEIIKLNVYANQVGKPGDYWIDTNTGAHYYKKIRAWIPFEQEIELEAVVSDDDDAAVRRAFQYNRPLNFKIVVPYASPQVYLDFMALPVSIGRVLDPLGYGRVSHYKLIVAGDVTERCVSSLPGCRG